MAMPQRYDVIIAGAGTAGIPAAIFASRRGAKVLLIEHADKVGGALHISGGQLSAAGTRVQEAKGIVDSADHHFADVMRISNGTADKAMVRLAVENAVETLHWLLDGGFEPLPEHPVIVFGHETYGIPRTYWGVDNGRSILKVLSALLSSEIARGNNIDLRLQTELAGLERQEDGTVIGITARDAAGATLIYHGDNVVITTGGYAANPELFARFTNGIPLFTHAYPYAQGTGIRLILEAGGQLLNSEKFLPTFGRIEDPDDPGRIANIIETRPQERLPWEIYVNLDGERFIAEDTASPDARERAILAQRGLTFWAVYDSAVERQAPGFFHTISPQRVDSLFNTHPSFVRADSLAELAQRAGIDETALIASVTGYNDKLDRKEEDPLGRRHRPRPITEPPFQAVKLHGTTNVSFGGVAVDHGFRVLANGKPIPNLYAAGEALGFGLVNGNAFAGGMGVTPALTFGRLLGQKLLDWRRACAAAE